MNIIRKNITNNVGKMVEVTYNGSRNKIEIYRGIITETYNSLFIIKLDTGLNKSFSYVDVLTGVISIKY